MVDKGQLEGAPKNQLTKNSMEQELGAPGSSSIMIHTIFGKLILRKNIKIVAPDVTFQG